MSKKIFFNALQYAPNGAGISKYTYKLSEQYLNNYDNINILARNDIEFNNTNKNLIVYEKDINNSKDRIIAEQLIINNMLNKCDLIHYPDYAIPIFCNKPCIVTIHDMNRYALPQAWTKMQKLIFKAFMDITVKRAKKIICDSKFTSNELIKYYPKIDISKIETVLLGFETSINSNIKNSFSKIMREHKIIKPYMLYVGTISPHKNIKRMIKAFSNIKKQGHDYQLVIAGKKGWMYEEIFNIVKQRQLETEVIFTDYISDEDLELLYKNCMFSVFISLYEGFGFPPLEAMARNKAVLVSNVSSIPEVVGEAGLYCNPLDINDISKKMITLIGNENLKKELINKGQERLKLFTWEKTAKKTYAVYEEILNKRVIL